MSIKNFNAPNKDAFSRQFNQGYFTPKNLFKYVGQYPIIYRSGLELKFCKMCDSNTSITRWSSESIALNYYNPVEQKEANYYPDYLIEILKDNILVKYMVEIKPRDFIVKPKQPAKTASIQQRKNYNYKLKNYIVNMHKKIAADKFCKENNMKYIFLTESFFRYF